VPPKIVDDLLDQQMLATFAEGTTIFTQRSPGDVIYCVRAGVVDILYHDTEIGTVVVDIATAGDLLGFMDVRDGVTSHQIFLARAHTRCEIGMVTRERIARALEKLSPATLVSIAEQVNDWWSAKLTFSTTFVGLSTRDRLEIVLSRLADKCGVTESYGSLIPRYSHADLAAIVAASRPMVTRLLGDMTSAGSLERRGRRYLKPIKSANARWKAF
jgi:CRP/FNR family transcriptional regulator